MQDLHELTATQAVSLLKRRELSPLELIDAAVDRIEATNPGINALVTLCVERAREHAQRIIRQDPKAAPPCYLYGLPIAVKDNTDVAGVRCTYGSRIYADRIATASDLVVQRLEANGAVVIAKSNLPEFAAGGNTFNDVFGATRNPWNGRMSASGSSGGEGYMGWLVMTYAITMTACPVMALPCGFTKSGLPVGMQVIGKPRGEAALFSAAAYIEKLFGIAGCTPLDPRF